MSTADTRLFFVAIMVVLTLALGSLWYNLKLETALSGGGREVNLELIRKKVAEGSLSLHEADFQKPFEGEENGL